MPRGDWLLGGGRRAIPARKIYDPATHPLPPQGPDAFDIDVLAARVHCSRATIYRYAGGKAEIRDAVVARSAARIVDRIREAVADLQGRERAFTAITLALKLIRSDPM